MAFAEVVSEFWAKVDVRGPDECWEWQRARQNPHGYGRTGAGSYAHRLAFQYATGQNPDGFYVIHTCDNPPCCNPRHLRLGTARDNAQDMAAKGRVGGGAPKGVYPHWTRPYSPSIIAHENGTCTKGHDASNFVRRTNGPRAGDVVYCRVCRNEQRRAARKAVAS